VHEVAGDGYIKLYRKLLDNPIVCKDSDHLAIWTYLLLSATWKPYDVLFEGQKTTLNPGQLITGRKAISQKFDIDEYKVQRILKLFENEQLIAQQTTPRNRLISVLSWDMYQQDAQQDEQQLHNNCTTDAQQLHTNNKIKKDKKSKNIRNIGENTGVQELPISFSLLSPTVIEAVQRFVENRKAMRKPMTDNAVDLFISKLNRIAKTDEEKIETINRSIVAGYTDIYELKNGNGSRGIGNGGMKID